MARIISLVVLVAILALMAVLFFQVMASFLLPVFLAVLLVVMFGPVHRWFVARCKGRDRLAAALTTVAILLIVLTPVLLVFFQAVHESVHFYRDLSSGQLNRSTIVHYVMKAVNRIDPDLTAEDLQNALIGRPDSPGLLTRGLVPVGSGAAQFLATFLGRFFVGLIVMVFSLYYFLVDGPVMIRALTRLLPLDQRYTHQLVEQFANVTRAVVDATLLSAIIQGLLAGLAFYLAGFPSLFLLTVLATLLAMVPFVGPPLVWVPACLFLYFHQDRATAAVLLAIYGTAVVSTVDNIVKPMVLHGRSNLHPLLALLSVLGGIQALGLIGIFVGPMAVAFLQTLLNLVHDELTAMQAGQPAAAASEQTQCKMQNAK
ncbi:MAG: AI-2E family transporter [Thermoguttaceae bacterium]